MQLSVLDVLATALMLQLSTAASSAVQTVSLFLPDTDPQKLVGSIAGANPTATTYVIHCPEDSEDCGYPEPITMIEGPSTLHYTLSEPGITASIDCKLYGTTSALCTESFGGSAAQTTGILTQALDATEITFLPVTITAVASASVSTTPGHVTPTTTQSPISGSKDASKASTASPTSTASSASTGAGMHISPLTHIGAFGIGAVSVIWALT